MYSAMDLKRPKKSSRAATQRKPLFLVCFYSTLQSQYSCLRISCQSTTWRWMKQLLWQWPPGHRHTRGLFHFKCRQEPSIDGTIGTVGPLVPSTEGATIKTTAPVNIPSDVSRHSTCKVHFISWVNFCPERHKFNTRSWNAVSRQKRVWTASSELPTTGTPWATSCCSGSYEDSPQQAFLHRRRVWSGVHPFHWLSRAHVVKAWNSADTHIW